MSTWFRHQVQKARMSRLMLEVWIQRRFTRLARKIDPKDLKGWMPAFITKERCPMSWPQRAQLQVLNTHIQDANLVWLNLNGLRLTAPWLFGEYQRAKQAAVTNVDFLTQIQRTSNSIAPTGFIFHVGKCGSTLLKNMLARIPENLALGEPEVVNQILYARDVSLRATWLQGAVNAMGQAYTGLEKHYFIKFASICVPRMGLIRQIFPDVPAVFLYRDPVEVIHSVLDGNVWWMFLKNSHPELAEEVTGIESSLVRQLSPEEYAARVIGRFFNNALKEADKSLLVVNYNRLSEKARLRDIVSFFSVRMSDLQIDCMLNALKVYSKDPTGRKQYGARETTEDEPSPEVWKMAEKWAIGPYEALEALT
jgi:hypothetical protein